MATSNIAAESHAQNDGEMATSNIAAESHTQNDDEMTTSNNAAESHTQNDEEMATSNNPGFHTFFFAVSFYILFSVVPFYFWASIRSFLRCRYTYFFRLSHFTFGLPYVPFCGVVTYLITRKTRFLQFFVVVK